MVEGHVVWHITCRRCGHKVERIRDDNELVGKQDRLVCIKCGHRGADILRVWTQGKAPSSS